MMRAKNTLSMWVMVCAVLMGSVSVFAKSVYVISNTDTGAIQAYTIGDNELILRAEQSFPAYAIGLAVDESPAGTFLFVTYEQQPFIRVIDAKSMEKVNDAALPEAADLAGIAYDAERNKVYVVDRLSNHLYSYTWDAHNLSLEPDFDEPYYRVLDKIAQGDFAGAVGLAFDAAHDRLYISDVTDEVKYYDVTDWSYKGSLPLSGNAIGIAVDPSRDVLYYADMGYKYGPGFEAIVRYDLTQSDPNLAETQTTTGAPVAGLALNPNTGNLFATLFGSDGDTAYPDAAAEDSVQMFCPCDPNNHLTRLWDSNDIGNPSGIVFSNDDYKPSGIHIEKTDDAAGCVSPGTEVTYTIELYSTADEQTNTVVTDVLPYEVNFVNAYPNTGFYDSENHLYIWDGITLPDPNQPGDPKVYLSITVQVNAGANPAGQIVNKVIAESDTAYDVGYGYTDVCCWGGDVIYVDRDARWKRTVSGSVVSASGYNNGLNWENAYRDLNDALERAAAGCGTEIRVAGGTYNPGYTYDDASKSYTDTFQVPANAKVYGGYAGYGAADPNERNWKKNETILSGYVRTIPVYDEFGTSIIGYKTYYNDTVITITGSGALLDGFTVTESSDSIDGGAIVGSSVDFTISNCTIEANEYFGLHAINCNVNLEWCNFKQNKWYAVRADGAGFTLTLSNCQIQKNQRFGVYCQDSTLVCKNSTISESDLEKEGREGIRLINPTYPPVLHNLTLAHNKGRGIFFTDNETVSDPNDKDYPDVQNCILWFNNANGIQYTGFDKEHIAYSCVYDPNDPNGVNLTKDANYNFSANPEFAYVTEPNNLPDPNNMHILFTSPCKEAGNPALLYTWQADMDKKPRVEGVVDIGAYEVRCSDGEISNELDWDADGLVNFEEFSVFQEAWLSRDRDVWDPNLYDPNEFTHWDARCDLDGDGRVALSDVVMFVEDDPQVWLWTACWKSIPDCPDSFNMLDCDGDGLVNMTEYALFASVWGTYQPGNSDWQFCNLDATGDSQYTIDLDDLMIFMDDWLWVSCTRAEEFAVPLVQSSPADPNTEPSILEQAIQLNENICFLTDLWQTDPNMQEQMDPNEWQDFMDTLCIELGVMIDSLSENELMAYNLIAGEDCCTQQQAMSGGDSVAESSSFGIESDAMIMESTYAQSEPTLGTVELEENPYTEMSTGEVSELAVGIYSVLDVADTALSEGVENPEDWLEIKDFLESVLTDIKASRQ